MLTSGPFSLPMTSRQAFALEALLKSLPDKLEPRRLSLAQTLPEPDSRSDISWITTEAPDRQGDIVLASGMDDSTSSSIRSSPSTMITRARPSAVRSAQTCPGRRHRGIKAKTYYPPRPKDWSDGPWLPISPMACFTPACSTPSRSAFFP